MCNFRMLRMSERMSSLELPKNWKILKPRNSCLNPQFLFPCRTEKGIFNSMKAWWKWLGFRVSCMEVLWVPCRAHKEIFSFPWRLDGNDLVSVWVAWKRYDFHVELTRKCFHFHDGLMEMTWFPCEFHGNVMISMSKDMEVRRFPWNHMEIGSFPRESTWNIFSRVLLHGHGFLCFRKKINNSCLKLTTPSRWAPLGNVRYNEF